MLGTAAPKGLEVMSAVVPAGIAKRLRSRLRYAWPPSFPRVCYPVRTIGEAVELLTWVCAVVDGEHDCVHEAYAEERDIALSEAGDVVKRPC
ncbi:unnamed protein product [Phytophthora fragariaefolia]|uniref:Unnamed protein product n=1 Tax=Phytophthora fragariaefolia TaxID=1490495 RepID=A0A9W7DA27_9STRA|nr:unnamed protein product [Phytophthora fragariaefolia]